MLTLSLVTAVSPQSKNLVTEVSFAVSINLVTEVSFELSMNLVTVVSLLMLSMNFVTARSFTRKSERAAYKNFVTVTSFASRNLVTAVSLSIKNLVTVVSMNFVTVMSLDSRNLAEEVPRN